jgi:hypothetical protein
VLLRGIGVTPALHGLMFFLSEDRIEKTDWLK